MHAAAFSCRFLGAWAAMVAFKASSEGEPTARASAPSSAEFTMRPRPFFRAIDVAAKADRLLVHADEGADRRAAPRASVRGEALHFAAFGEESHCEETA